MKKIYVSNWSCNIINQNININNELILTYRCYNEDTGFETDTEAFLEISDDQIQYVRNQLKSKLVE